MKPLTILADVPHLDRASRAEQFRRVAGMLDAQSLAVATMVAGEAEAQTELIFSVDDAVRLAERVLAGDPRARTQPGLARILSATACVLFRVAQQAGAIQSMEIFDGDDANAGHLDDQQEAGGDEGAGD
ncbi:MAG: hypothetical protein ABTQ31_17230 [Rhizobiaceae bacterium]